MEMHTFTVSTREGSGKGAARQLRAQGKIPGILYGQDEKPLGIVIDAHDFHLLVHTKGGEHSLLDLTVEGHPDLSCRAMIKDVQHHPVRGHFLHADFFRIDMNKKITTLVPVIMIGQSKGVIEGGVLDHQTRELSIECLPSDVPEDFVVDVTELLIGQNVLVRDIEIPEGVTVLISGDRALVSVHAPRVIEEVVEEVEELEEGAEVEGEEGEKTTAESEDSDG